MLAREQAPADLFPLLLAVWAEATINPALIEVADSILSGLRALLTTMLDRWVAAGGRLPMPADQLTPIFLSLVQGFVIQQALAGPPMADDYQTAVGDLFTAAGLGGH